MRTTESITSELISYITGRIIARAHRAHSSYLYEKRVILTTERIFFKVYVFGIESVLLTAVHPALPVVTRANSRVRINIEAASRIAEFPRCSISLEIHRIQLTGRAESSVSLTVLLPSPSPLPHRKQLSLVLKRVWILDAWQEGGRKNPFFLSRKKAPFLRRIKYTLPVVAN